MQPTTNPDIQPVHPTTERLPSAQQLEQNTSQEILPTTTEREPLHANNTPTTQQQVAQQQPQAASSHQPQQVLSPQAAAKHDDLTTSGGDDIEKEWVDRADSIIHAYADDPYREDTEHEDLSAAYLKKRFGLEVKRNNDSKGT